MERHLIDQGSNSFWTICVNYLNSALPDATRPQNLSRNRVDYKGILSPDEFEIFSRLRELRKDIAQAEAVPVYALFSNQQLAQMAQRRCPYKEFYVHEPKKRLISAAP